MEDSRYRVADFYDGKSVLLTGATGFLGSVLLEDLLRCCQGIKSIYVILRKRKGMTAELRNELILDKLIFKKLRAENPGVFGKVHAIEGDVTLHNLGLRDEDLYTLMNEVSVVFHCAASISFFKPLRFMILNNCKGTQNVIDVCKKLIKLDVLVCTSTAFSNSNRPEEVAQEKVYKLQVPAKQFLEAVEESGDKNLHHLMSQCKPDWPNHYSFSKCVSENLVMDAAYDIPTVVIRPSLIIASWKGAAPGFADETSALSSIIQGAGKGFVRTINCNPKSHVNIIPVDVVANTHVIAAWSVATRRNASPLVINCTATTQKLNVTMEYILERFVNACKVKPLPNSYQIPSSVKFRQYRLIYWWYALIEHYAPAAMVDIALRISGSKPRFLALYKLYDKTVQRILFFLNHEWTFATQNFVQLNELLNGNEKEMLTINLDACEPDNIISDMADSAPFYQWKLDKKSLEERKRVMKQSYMVTQFVKNSLLILHLLLFYISFRKLIRVLLALKSKLFNF